MQNISSFIPIFTSINLHKKCGYKISTQGKEKKDRKTSFAGIDPELSFTIKLYIKSSDPLALIFIIIFSHNNITVD